MFDANGTCFGGPIAYHVVEGNSNRKHAAIWCFYGAWGAELACLSTGGNTLQHTFDGYGKKLNSGDVCRLLGAGMPGDQLKII